MPDIFLDMNLNMKTNCFYLFCLALILSACEKESPDKSKDSILAGDYENMNVKIYGIIWGYESGLSHIDINNDSIDDYTLHMYAGSQFPEIEIESLDSINMILGELRTDTTFFHTDGRYKYYACYNMTKNDKVYQISENVFKLRPKKENDIIRKSDYFQADKVCLLQENLHWLQHAGNDWEGINIIRDCDNVPLNIELYIGIKMRINGTEKLGWIKILILKNYLLLLDEAAIQE
jgi:hypothetical protein